MQNENIEMNEMLRRIARDDRRARMRNAMRSASWVLLSLAAMGVAILVNELFSVAP